MEEQLQGIRSIRGSPDREGNNCPRRPRGCLGGMRGSSPRSVGNVSYCLYFFWQFITFVSSVCIRFASAWTRERSNKMKTNKTRVRQFCLLSRIW